MREHGVGLVTTWPRLAREAHTQRALTAISELLANPPTIYQGALDDPAQAVSLVNREPGFALFFAYLYAATERPRWRELAEMHIDTALAAVPEALAKRRTFFGYGVAGLAWTIAHLDGWLCEGAEETLDELDAMLLALLDADVVDDFALPHGLVGYGVYALERWPHPAGRELLHRVVVRLVAMARPHNNGVAWQVSDNGLVPPHIRAAHPDGIFVRGVFEGAAGAVALLSAAARRGVTCDGLEDVVAKALDFIWAARPAGSGWAVGDLGIAGAIAATGSPAHRALGLKRAIELADPARVQQMDDPSLIGGTAGSCLTFLRLAAATGEPTLLEAARASFERTLALFDPERDGGGYRFWQAPWQREHFPQLETGWIVDPGLLNGAAGVGLVLLAATTAIEPRWDRCLLLSVKEPS